MLHEFNVDNTAEANNAASAVISSQARDYADLRVGGISAPAAAISGRNLTLSWTVTNHGAVATGSAWTDQVVLSRDATIGNADDIVTVQRALGHSSATTTLNTYSHLWPTAEDRTRAAAADLMSQAFGAPPQLSDS